MKRTIRTILASLALGCAAGLPAVAAADYTVMCQSLGNRYNSCPISGGGHVRLARQISNAACIQGRTWGYDRNAIWVDEGCRAEFRVRGHRSSNSSSDGAATAAGIILGAAIIGALFGNKDPQPTASPGAGSPPPAGGPPMSTGGGAPVPDWLVGTFRGYTATDGAEVIMTISADGMVTATASGQSARGYVFDQGLYVEGAIFDVNPTGSGFVTSQRGTPRNEVHYLRLQ